MYYFLVKLWCVVSMVLIVIEETNREGLVVSELKEPGLGGTKTVGAIRSCVSFGDALVEAGVLLLFFLDLGLLRAFGQEMESEGPREECMSLVGRLEEALFFSTGCWGAYVMSSLVLILLTFGSWFLATADICFWLGD